MTTTPALPRRAVYARRLLALILLVVDVPAFVLMLLSALLMRGYSALDPVGAAHALVLAAWLGASCVLAVVLLWNVGRWRTTLVVVVAALCLSWPASCRSSGRIR